MNEAFQEYKRKARYGIVVAQVTTKGIEQVEVLEPEEVEETEEVIEIPVYDMTPEEQAKYEEYKRQRNQRVIDKFKGEER